ncbi:MAG: hypothetical protein HFI76_03050 [Lachnospiraceae bacterium]|nr:hypothetical protein [Lachnospiraceae bacterium]
MKKIMKHLKLFLQAVAYYIWTSLHKKDKKLWLFGEWKGTSYSDNPKYLFEYVSVNHPEINAVWITKNKDIYELVKNKGYKAQLYPSKKARTFICRAGVLVESEGSCDIGHFPVGGATVMQLSHGIPAKRCLWFQRNTNRIKQLIIHIESDNHSKSLWPKPSQYYQDMVEVMYDVPKDNFIDAGFPRHDAITYECRNKYIKKLHQEHEKMILYLPTHRNWGVDFDLNFLKSGLVQMDEFGKKNGIYFLYKPHPNEVSLVMNMGLDLANVYILEGSKFQDLYEYLYECDGLISDYSSVIYDFLPINRPIVLFDYDLEHYQTCDGGVPEDYFKHPIGPICYDWDSMLNSVKESLDCDPWKEIRSKEIMYFNATADGKNSERVFQALAKRLSLHF